MVRGLGVIMAALKKALDEDNPMPVVIWEDQDGAVMFVASPEPIKPILVSNSDWQGDRSDPHILSAVAPSGEQIDLYVTVPDTMAWGEEEETVLQHVLDGGW